MDPIWGDRFRDPVFVFTADQDWAPEWAVKATLRETLSQDVPLHLFVTNPSRAVEEANVDPRLSLGIHPNFLPGSSHGATVDEVIHHCGELVPDALTFRCHSFFEHTPALAALFARGYRADSNLGLFGQACLQPMLHCTGLLRFPVFFEDDVFYNLAGPDLSLKPLEPRLFTPGLKVLNFHPALVGANIPSQREYDASRSRLFAPEAEPLEYENRGVRDVLRELIARIRTAGAEVISFPLLVAQVDELVQTGRSDALYAWGEPWGSA